jgi:hypothetical protein
MIPPERLDGLLLKVASGEAEVTLARRLHHDCYARNGFMKPRADRLFGDEYSPYSTYLLCGSVGSSGGETSAALIGTMRMISHSEMGFQALEKFAVASDLHELDAVDWAHAVELSGLATVPGCAPAKPLFRYAREWSDARRDSHWLAVLEERTWALFRKRYLFLFDRIGQPAFYMGASTAPYIMDRRRQHEYLVAAAPLVADFYYGDPPDAPEDVDIPFRYEGEGR